MIQAHMHTDPSGNEQHTVESLLGNTDIYLVDQIMKGRYSMSDRVLDAGCGEGRNLHWFVARGIEVFGIDRDAVSIGSLLRKYPTVPHEHILAADVGAMPFEDNFFDAVISSAVLHFADSDQEFFRMFRELVRVLKPGGTLFVRMATEIGVEKSIRRVQDGVYDLADGSRRFLLTRRILSQISSSYPLAMIEDFKTVVVNDARSMAVVLWRKQGLQ
jgi:SAM-dependent methyltransferase